MAVLSIASKEHRNALSSTHTLRKRHTHTHTATRRSRITESQNMAGKYVRDVNGAVRQAPQRPLRVDSRPSKHDSFSSDDDSDEDDSAAQPGRRSYMPPVHAAASSNTVAYRGGPSLQVVPQPCALHASAVPFFHPLTSFSLAASLPLHSLVPFRHPPRAGNWPPTCTALTHANRHPPPGRTTCRSSSAFQQSTSGRWKEALPACWPKWARQWARRQGGGQARKRGLTRVGGTPKALATSAMARISPTHVQSTRRSATTILTPGATLAAKRPSRWVRAHAHTQTHTHTHTHTHARKVRAQRNAHSRGGVICLLAVFHSLALFYLQRPPLPPPGLFLPLSACLPSNDACGRHFAHVCMYVCVCV